MSGADDLTFLSAGSNSVTLCGADTLVATAGPVTVASAGAAGGPGDLTFATGGALDYIGGATQDTVVAASGTVVGGSAALAVYGNGTGGIDYRGGAGYSTVASGIGAVTVDGGAGGGLFVGGTMGGSDVRVDGGAAVVFGGGNGDQIDLTNAATDYFISLGGAETIAATTATGNDYFFCGSGADLVEAGSGNDIITAGRGNATMFGGGGDNVFSFNNGSGGGNDVVADWTPIGDFVYLGGYGADAAADAAAVAGAVQVGNSLVMTLPDNTRVTFLNTHTLSTANFF